MPELPDLQVFSQNLERELKGKTIKEIEVPNSKKLNVPVKELKETLEGQSISHVKREGKELHIDFKNGDVLGLHLMLHGQLFLLDKGEEKKNTIIALHFTDKRVLLLTDYQGAATPTLNPKIKDSPDAMSNEVNYEFLKKALEKKRTNIKTFLLDQNIIRGIGNAYADEILWEAKIAPLSICNKIPDDMIKALAKAIKEVLQDAEKQIKKSHPDIISGEVRDFLKIHNSKKKESPTGGAIEHEMLNSRITYYTDEQELYK
jgi:formamidopyrimidine-DNA glycosylase